MKKEAIKGMNEMMFVSKYRDWRSGVLRLELGGWR